MATRNLKVSEVIPPKAFVHAVIRTSRMEEMICWYEHVLGAQVVFSNDVVCFLTYDDEHHRIALLKASKSVPQDTDGCGIDHIAYAYEDLGELLATYYRLKSHGIEPVRTINHGPTISFYYRDPEGVKLELQVDNFDTIEDSRAFFHGKSFAENPIGVLIEPDQLRADWEAGVPWTEIKKRPPLPPGASPSDMQRERK